MIVKLMDWALKESATWATVRLNVAGIVPGALAVAVKVPTFDPAVRVGAVATPEPSLTALPNDIAPANERPADAEKTTLTPDRGLPFASRTVTWSGIAKAVLTRVLWPDPAVTVTEAGAIGATVKGVLVTGAKPGEVARRLWLPEAAMLKAGKDARPVAGSAVVVLPKIAPVPEVRLSVTGIADAAPPAGRFALGA